MARTVVEPQGDVDSSLMMSVRNLCQCVCDIVATVTSCPLDGEDRGRATRKCRFQSDHKCKKPLSVCVCDIVATVSCSLSTRWQGQW